MPVPKAELGPAVAGVTVEGIEGRAGEYLVSGPMLSVAIHPVEKGPLAIVFRARATPCRDPTGEDWPRVQVYLGDRKISSQRIDGTEIRAYRTPASEVGVDTTLSFFLAGDYEDSRCDRAVYLETFDVARAGGT